MLRRPGKAVDKPRSLREARRALARLLPLAVAEDLGSGDVTSQALIPKALRVRGVYLAKAGGVVAGLPFLADVFARFGRGVRVKLLARDGARVRPGMKLAEVRGPARAVLAGERLSLNLLCHLSGVATLTARFVRECRGTPARVYDTRKTMPGLRALEKYAVAAGGGANHRMGLFDAVLIKDNHLTVGGRRLAVGGKKAGPRCLPDIAGVVRRAKATDKPIEVEVVDIAGLRAAVSAGADVVMLDNFTPTGAKLAVEIVRKFARQRQRSIEVEISGGVNLGNVRRYALARPDRISIGALTHSAPALDISLELVKL